MEGLVSSSRGKAKKSTGPANKFKRSVATKSTSGLYARAVATKRTFTGYKPFNSHYQLQNMYQSSTIPENYRGSKFNFSKKPNYNLLLTCFDDALSRTQVDFHGRRRNNLQNVNHCIDMLFQGIRNFSRSFPSKTSHKRYDSSTHNNFQSSPEKKNYHTSSYPSKYKTSKSKQEDYTSKRRFSRPSSPHESNSSTEIIPALHRSSHSYMGMDSDSITYSSKVGGSDNVKSLPSKRVIKPNTKYLDDSELYGMNSRKSFKLKLRLLGSEANKFEEPYETYKDPEYDYIEDQTDDYNYMSEEYYEDESKKLEENFENSYRMMPPQKRIRKCMDISRNEFETLSPYMKKKYGPMFEAKMAMEENERYMKMEYMSMRETEKYENDYESPKDPPSLYGYSSSYMDEHNREQEPIASTCSPDNSSYFQRTNEYKDDRVNENEDMHDTQPPYLQEQPEYEMEFESSKMNQKSSDNSEEVDINVFYGKRFGHILNPSLRDNSHYLPSLVYKCSNCPQTFNNSVVASKHIVQHVEDERIMRDKNSRERANPYCHLCLLSLSSKEELRLHIERGHSEPENLDLEMCCGICCLVFADKGELVNHMKIRHKSKHMPYQCSICNYSSSIKSYLLQHVDKHHAGSNLMFCSFCLQSIKLNLMHSSNVVDLDPYYQHLSRHFTTEQTRCKKCSLTFNSHKDAYKHEMCNCNNIPVPKSKGILDLSFDESNVRFPKAPLIKPKGRPPVNTRNFDSTSYATASDSNEYFDINDHDEQNGDSEINYLMNNNEGNQDTRNDEEDSGNLSSPSHPLPIKKGNKRVHDDSDLKMVDVVKHINTQISTNLTTYKTLSSSEVKAQMTNEKKEENKDTDTNNKIQKRQPQQDDEYALPPDNFNPRDFICAECDSKTSQYSTHYSTFTLRCEKCPYQTYCKQSLYTHSSICVTRASKNVGAPEFSTAKFNLTCKGCAFSTFQGYEMIVHMSESANKKCSFCFVPSQSFNPTQKQAIKGKATSTLANKNKEKQVPTIEGSRRSFRRNPASIRARAVASLRKENSKSSTESKKSAIEVESEMLDDANSSKEVPEETKTLPSPIQSLTVEAEKDEETEVQEKTSQENKMQEVKNEEPKVEAEEDKACINILTEIEKHEFYEEA